MVLGWVHLNMVDVPTWLLKTSLPVRGFDFHPFNSVPAICTKLLSENEIKLLLLHSYQPIHIMLPSQRQHCWHYYGILSTFPKCNFWEELPEITSQKFICYHWLSLRAKYFTLCVQENSEIMHCGILFIITCWCILAAMLTFMFIYCDIQSKEGVTWS